MRPRARASVASHGAAGIFVRASTKPRRARVPLGSPFLLHQRCGALPRAAAAVETLLRRALCAAANCEIASRRTLDLCGSLSATSPTPGSCRAAAGLSASAITSLEGMILCLSLIRATYYEQLPTQPGGSLRFGSVPSHIKRVRAKNLNARTKPKRPSRPVRQTHESYTFTQAQAWQAITTCPISRKQATTTSPISPRQSYKHRGALLTTPAARAPAARAPGAPP